MDLHGRLSQALSWLQQPSRSGATDSSDHLQLSDSAWSHGLYLLCPASLGQRGHSSYLHLEHLFSNTLLAIEYVKVALPMAASGFLSAWKTGQILLPQPSENTAAEETPESDSLLEANC